MKRTIGPFAVEHKRRSKLNKTATPSLWSGALSDELKAFMRDNVDPEASQSAEEVEQERPRKGSRTEARSPRILESRAATAEVEPEEAQAEANPAPEAGDAPDEAAPVRRGRGRPRKTQGLDKALPPEPIAPTEPAGSAESSWPRASASLPATPREALSDAAAAAVPEPLAATLAADGASADAAPVRRPSRVALRRARTKDVPFHERWKWNLLP